MSKPYDAAGKELLQSDPVGWAALLGIVRPPERIELRDSELSTITAAADKVLLIKDEPNWMLNVEFLSWPDACAPRQLQMYSALLQQKNDTGRVGFGLDGAESGVGRVFRRVEQ